MGFLTKAVSLDGSCGNREAESRSDRFWRVPIFPVFDIQMLFGRPGPAYFPIDARRCLLTANARTALAIGLEFLDLSTNDSILVPVYSCGTELDAVVARGISLDFYAVDERLQVDLDSVRSALKPSTKAILVTHYFGFPQSIPPLLEFAQKHGLKLIEDNAHGLFSNDEKGDPLGCRGDISIFSLYKSLPVPDGGALVVNSDDGPFELEAGLQRTSLAASLGQMRTILERSLFVKLPWITRYFFQKILDPLVLVLKRRAKTDSRESCVDAGRKGERSALRRDAEIVTRYRPAAFTEFAIRRQNVKEIILSRRRNYAELVELVDSMEGVVVPVRELPVGCVPLFLPVIESEDSQPLRRRLLEAGIESHKFGFERDYFPDSGFEWESRLRNNLTTIPIHQSLSTKDLEFMKQILRSHRLR